MNGKTMRGVGVIAAAAVLIGLAVVVTGFWVPGSSPAEEGAAEQSDVGALDYDMGEGATLNPWIAAACHWPSMAPAAIAALRTSPPDGAHEHFARRVKRAVAKEWLPDGFPEGVPYLTKWGFVSVKQTEEYRVRVREATKPAAPGLPVMVKAVVIAVEPLAAPIPLPEDEAAMVTLQSAFPGPRLSGSVQEDQEAPRFYRIGPARFLARYTGAGRLYTWTDGKILLMAVEEDAHYGTGPTPPRATEPTPPPGEEEIEVQPGAPEESQEPEDQ